MDGDELGAPADRLHAVEAALDALRTAGHEGDVAAAGAATATLKGEVDQLQTGLVAEMRAREWSWGQVGDALGMSRQAAHERFRHLPTRQASLTQPPGGDGEPPAAETGSGETGTAPTAPAEPAEAAGPGRPARASQRGGAAGRQKRPRVRAADFDGDPYGLERDSETGRWRVTDHGHRVGTVARRASLTGRSASWEAWTVDPHEHLGSGYDTRAEAAFAVIYRRHPRGRRR